MSALFLNPAWISFVATLVAMAALRPSAAHLGLVDRPSGHKRHAGEIPVIGGIAMLIGLSVALITTSGGAFDARLFLVSAGLLVLVGALDDAVALSPRVRLLVHAAAALWIYAIPAAGVRLTSLGDLFGVGNVDLSAVSMLATVFVIVATINAFNMLDGIDGLAGGVALVALTMLFGPTSRPLCPAFTQIALGLIGGLGGFLVFNAPLGVNRALRSFMGDAGSTVLGFALATIMIGASQGAARVAAPVTMVWLLLVPATDIVWTVVRRLLRGRSPLYPDTGHLHHVLAEAHLKAWSIWLTLIAVSIAAGLAGLALERDGTPEWLSLGLLIGSGTLLVLGVHGVRLARRRAPPADLTHDTA